ncbi:MAG: MoaD family protein [Candidatus Geothermincolales bacterium]
MATVKLYSTIRLAAGEKVLESDAKTVGELLKDLERRYGEKISRYISNCIVLVNGKNISLLKGKRTKLEPTDQVSLFPPVAGG